MQPTIKFIKEGKRFLVKFQYNSDLVEIMHEHNGWWWFKEKCWTFPLHKLEKLKDDLTHKMYQVEVTTSNRQPKTKQTVLKVDVFKDKDVVSVWGTCKKCERVGFVSKEGLCVRCK